MLDNTNEDKEEKLCLFWGYVSLMACLGLNPGETNPNKELVRQTLQLLESSKKETEKLWQDFSDSDPGGKKHMNLLHHKQRIEKVIELITELYER